MKDSSFEQLQHAVQARIRTEWDNYQAGLHQPGVKRAAAQCRREEAMAQVLRMLAAIRRSDRIDPRWSLETVEARLTKLARVGEVLRIWEQLCPKPEPVPLMPPDQAVWSRPPLADLDPETI